MTNEETVSQFSKRLGLRKTTVSRKLHSPDCPIRSFTAFEGPSGRISSLISSPQLEAYMLKYKVDYARSR